jgi:three-Cys-motif partner protein
MAADPSEYEGREQTWVKHRVLELYLESWAHKLGSIARKRGKARLWYVDCFSGPWKAANEDLHDTSIYIGLKALSSAAESWKGEKVELGAIFVEKKPSAFRELQSYLRSYSGPVEVHPFHGEFGEYVEQIQSLIGNDPAFLFVDPTGWLGAGMRYIAPLASRKRRDVLVNVMVHHINRFKEDPRAHLKAQLQEFFGLGDEELPHSLSERDYLALYREKLKTTCGLKYAADLAVLHPTIDRTYFRLVVGGHDPKVMTLFRDVEKRVVGRESVDVRARAKERAEADQQATLFQFEEPIAPLTDQRYDAQREAGLREVEEHLPALLKKYGHLQFGSICPRILEVCHLTEPDLKKLLWNMKKKGKIQIVGVKGRERLQPQHFLRLPNTDQPEAD